MTTPTSDQLGTVITSAKARRIIYTVYVLALVLAGAVQVGFAAVDAGQPDLLTGTLAVLAYLGIPVGGLAAVNTPPAPADVSRGDTSSLEG